MELSPALASTSVHPVAARCIESEKYEQKHGESQQGRAPVAEERERYAYHRTQPDHHPDVYAQMENQNRHHAIGVDPFESRTLPLRDMNQSQY